MKNFKTGYEWLDTLMPEGLPILSSTIISGGGGSGKPLIGFSVVSSWLKQGGSAAIILTSTGKDFAEGVMSRLYNIEVKDYIGNLFFIDFDPTIDSMKNLSSDMVRANLVKPDIWDKSIKEACSQLKESDLGILIFGSALNLLIFSKTYGNSILEKLRKTVTEDKTKTYFFTVSTSAFREKIKILEEGADNLMFTRTEEPMRLYLKITKMKGVKFLSKEVEVPLTTKDLRIIKEIAETSRRDLIPVISKI